MPVDDIRHRIEKDFGYDLSMCVEELRPRYSWNILDEAGNGGMCQGINSCIRASSYAARAELKPRFLTWALKELTSEMSEVSANCEANWDDKLFNFIIVFLKFINIFHIVPWPPWLPSCIKDVSTSIRALRSVGESAKCDCSWCFVCKVTKKQGEQATVSLFFLRLYKLKSNLRLISFSKTVIFSQDPCASKLPRKSQGYHQEMEISGICMIICCNVNL